MDSVEYQGIMKFLTEETYPEEASVSRKAKWNYRRKVSPFIIGDSENRLYKVRIYIILFSLPTIL